MAVKTTSLIRKRLRQRFGISAPKVAIRTQIPWYWRALLVVLIVAFSIVLAAWMYEVGRRIAGFHSFESGQEISALRSRLGELESELAGLRQSSVAGESNVQIERSAKERLVRQVTQLEQENANLKEDLAFFESVVPGGDTTDEGLKISRLRVEPDGEAGHYRYRLLVVMDAGRVAREFKGSLQFAVKVQQGGKDVMMIYPPEGESVSGKFRLEVKRFLRTEGNFVVPGGGVVKSVEARLVQDGAIRARQVANL